MAADALETTASKLRSAAASRGGQAGTVASRTAEAIGSTAAYLRQHDLDDMTKDLEKTAKQYPAAALVAAAAVGFLLGTAWRR
jgi:ElaB/YqjD/DUF883 family membrane-anchored ribosome-binding protein